MLSILRVCAKIRVRWPSSTRFSWTKLAEMWTTLYTPSELKSHHNHFNMEWCGLDLRSSYQQCHKEDNFARRGTHASIFSISNSCKGICHGLSGCNVFIVKVSLHTFCNVDCCPLCEQKRMVTNLLHDLISKDKCITLKKDPQHIFLLNFT